MKVEKEYPVNHAAALNGGRERPVFLSRIFNVYDLVRAESTGAFPGNPTSLDSLLRSREGAREMGLGGAGIYAFLFEDELLHIGSYAGRPEAPFGGCALREKWIMELGSITMRGRQASIPQSLRGGLEAANLILPLSELADAAKRPDLPVWQSQGMEISRRKMIWAVANWPRLSGTIEAVLARFQILYVQQGPGEQPLLDNSGLERWLQLIETDLRRRFQPVIDGPHPQTAAQDAPSDGKTMRAAIESAMAEAAPLLHHLGSLRDRDMAISRHGGRDARALFLKDMPERGCEFVFDLEHVFPAMGYLIHYAADGSELYIADPYAEHGTRLILALERGSTANLIQLPGVTDFARSRDPLAERGLRYLDASDNPLWLTLGCSPRPQSAQMLLQICEALRNPVLQ